MLMVDPYLRDTIGTFEQFLRWKFDLLESIK